MWSEIPDIRMKPDAVALCAFHIIGASEAHVQAFMEAITDKLLKGVGLGEEKISSKTLIKVHRYCDAILDLAEETESVLH